MVVSNFSSRSPTLPTTFAHVFCALLMHFGSAALISKQVNIALAQLASRSSLFSTNVALALTIAASQRCANLAASPIRCGIEGLRLPTGSE